jgi:hypothetical protein
MSGVMSIMSIISIINGGINGVMANNGVSIMAASMVM